MSQNRYRSLRMRKPKKKDSGKSVDEIVKALKQTGNSSNSSGSYREQSLKMHGLFCAKCGKDFEHKDRSLLTVHHKDGDSTNNNPDGSNWENLCVYCHDDEHSRGMLGDYLAPSHPHPKRHKR